MDEAAGRPSPFSQLLHHQHYQFEAAPGVLLPQQISGTFFFSHYSTNIDGLDRITYKDIYMYYYFKIHFSDSSISMQI